MSVEKTSNDEGAVEIAEEINFLQMEGEERKTFEALIEEKGLRTVFFGAMPEYAAAFKRVFELNHSAAETDRTMKLLAKIGKYCQEMGIRYEDKLTFRCVLAEDEFQVPKILNDSLEWGGKKPGSDEIGVCVDGGPKINDYLLHYHGHRDHPLVLFVYDMAKLQRLTKEEREADSNFAAGYGVKPREGYTLSDTIKGRIVLGTEKKGDFLLLKLPSFKIEIPKDED
ncbi:hypothetical protein KKC94_04900 [Patescibacteria group bacterium]|nr:hypothetical protein [Patescibacteria group bacterium]